MLVDATVVRLVLVPAVMELLGKANWWLPGWLDRLLPGGSVPGGDVPAGSVLADGVLGDGERAALPSAVAR